MVLSVCSGAFIDLTFAHTVTRHICSQENLNRLNEFIGPLVFPSFFLVTDPNIASIWFSIITSTGTLLTCCVQLQ